MNEDYTPSGFNQVSPFLTVTDAHILVDFMVQVFNAEILERTERPDGKVSHAAVRIGDSSLEIAEATERFGPMPGALHIYVPDIDETHRRAIEYGAQVLHEPMEMDYGERASAIVDSSGNQWYIATFYRKNS